MGFTWNSKYFLFTVRLNDTLKMVDGLSEQLARLVLADQPLTFYEDLVNAAFYASAEQFSMVEDDPKVSLLFAIAEQFGVKDQLTDYIVNLALSDDVKALETIKLAASILADEDWDLNESIKVQAYYFLRDKFGIEDDKITYFMTLLLHDKFRILDHEPKEAISDWIIGTVGSVDRAFDYLEPLTVNFPDRTVGMRVDWGNTKLQVIPDAEHTTISQSGLDGDLIANTTYKDRLFSLVLFSDDNLTISQKEDLKRRIALVMDSAKKSAKKLTVQARGITFDAKYNSSEIKDGPSYIRADLEVLVPPYGKDLFNSELRDSGLINNAEGMAPLSPKFTITGSVTNPYFTLGGTTYRYNGTVPSGKRLIADFERYIVYLENDFGVKENALKNWVGEFQSIPAGSSEALTISSNLRGKFLAEWSVSLLW